MTDKPQTAADYLESLGKNLDDLEGLDLLEYLHFTATPAPWVVGVEDIERTQCCSEECIHADVDGQDRHIMETVYVSNDALFVAELRNAYPAMAEELRRLRALFVLVANCALQMELALEDDLPFKAESFRDELKALLVDHAPQETLSQVQKDMRWQTWQTVYKATKVEALQYENDRLRARVAELEGK